VGGNILARPVPAITIWGNGASWMMAALPPFIRMDEIACWPRPQTSVAPAKGVMLRDT
jgi:hypothetical protein